MASHELGKSVCLPACHPLPSTTTATTSPLPPFFHLTTQPVYSILHLVEQPCLSRFQQVSLSRAGRGFYVCTCKSFANMKSSKRTSWICSAWGVLSIPCLNRWICSMAKWPPVCQKSHPRPGAFDKCLHFWLSNRSYGKNWAFIWITSKKHF